MTAASFSVLVVGGYGGFGRRLVMLLLDNDGIEIHVAGRSHAKAAALCATDPARLKPVVLDRAADNRALLGEIRPDMVVDAAGPFQIYGARPYRLVEDCIALGIAYADLSDGREFVCGITCLDAAARAAGVAAFAGASSVPALSGAVIAALAGRAGGAERIEIGITPSGHVEMGPSVIRAILSYAGRTVDVLEDGRRRSRHCWTDLRREALTVGPEMKLNRRTFSLCDVPDLALWPERIEGVRSVYFGAALEPALRHYAMWCLAWAVRLRLLPGAGFLAGILHALAPWTPKGMDRGGMFVRVTGERCVQWTLIAEGDDGPYIPAMAAAALIGKMAEGWRPAPGAGPCVGVLELADFERLFALRRIHTAISDVEELPR